MAKQSGLGDNLYIGGYDLSGDIGSLNVLAGPVATLDVTGIDKSAHERIGGLRSGSMEFNAFFNPATDRAHPVLNDLPTSNVSVTYCRGTTLGNPSAVMVGKQINYDGNRAQDGAFTFSVQVLSSGYGGLEWGTQLTAGKRTDTGATNGTGVDFSASSAFGLQAYLQVFAFTGTSVTVALQESSDNAVGDPYAAVTGGAFAAATAVGTQRIATATNLTVERWLRVVTTGTFSNAVFAVTVVRNQVAVT